MPFLSFLTALHITGLAKDPHYAAHPTRVRDPEGWLGTHTMLPVLPVSETHGAGY